MSTKDYQDLNNVVLLNTFQIDKKRYRVFYNNETLIWEKEKSNKNKISIPIHDVISVSYPNRKNSSTTSTPQHTQQAFPVLNTTTSYNSVEIQNNSINNVDDFRCFTINYAKRCIDPKVQDVGSASSKKSCHNINNWRIHSITLHNNDKYIIKEWHDTLSKILNSLKRPRKLLLFINPYGGKKNALQLYEKYAKPIFQMANVDVSVIISQRPNQIFDLVMQQHLDQFDGIACSGGDGTFSELFNGLIYRKMMNEHSSSLENNEQLNIDFDNIQTPDIPCGIIPAGSTDTIAYCMHGTTDVKTCIIHIVLGQTTGLDISSISTDRGLIKFYASVVAYGYLGDIAFENDQYRFLGPKRYEYVGFKKILMNRGYDAELMLLQEPESNSSQGNENSNVCDNEQELKCYENCNVCSKPRTYNNNNNTDVIKPDNEGDEKYKRITGKFFMVNSANISCACERSPSGFSPYCHLGDGYMHLVLVRHGGFFQNIKLLLKLASKKGQIAEYPFVELYRTKKFYFKALNSNSEGSLTDSTLPISVGPNRYSSVWNCDGEVVQDTDVVVR
ncbi:hypothetical protein ACKWTF_011845 [Chironomus riparius]